MLLKQADTDEVVGKLKVLSLLESLPGVGKVKARRLMEEIGISETRRVQGLGPQQRQALLEQLRLTRPDRRHLRPGGVGKGTIVRALRRRATRACG